MANRVTLDAEVTGLLDGYDSTILLAVFITTANQITDQLEAEDSTSILSTAELTQIEAWLAAHFYSMRDQQLKAKSTGSASGSFRGVDGLGFSGTLHGQSAMLLDKTGWLAKRNKEMMEGRKFTATANWGGTEYSESNQNIH